MKLLTRGTYYFFIVSGVALIFAGIGFYYAIRSIVYKQIDTSLITEKTIIQDQIEETDTIPDFAASFGHQIEVQLIRHWIKYSQVINDTTIFESNSGKFLPFRHIKFAKNFGNGGYVINIYQALDENQKLLNRIAIGMLFLFIVILLMSIILNYLVSKKIWNPFYEALTEVGKFDVLSERLLDLPETNVNEFRRLNSVLDQMTRKIRKDYINLKEFNENLSHEIQTPLAVIRSKLDILMQNKDLKRESIAQIKSINEAATKLSRINKGLLLISKIENMQFPESREISIRTLIEKILVNYEEILHLKRIRVETEFTEGGYIRMNEDLADVMLSNLVGNAVRHNIDGGFIIFRINDSSLTITNSGLPIKSEPERLFERFQTGTDHPDAVGLGLSIVKKIADLYHMQVRFSNYGTVHEIKLDFRR